MDSEDTSSLPQELIDVLMGRPELTKEVRDILESTEPATYEQIDLIKRECSATPDIIQHALWRPWFTRKLDGIQRYNDAFLAKQFLARQAVPRPKPNVPDQELVELLAGELWEKHTHNNDNGSWMGSEAFLTAVCEVVDWTIAWSKT